MPDEFKLRPHTYGPQASDHERGFVGFLNHAHEQGARALAAAIIAKHDARLRDLVDHNYDMPARVVQDCINDIHRLVPPGAGKEKA